MAYGNISEIRQRKELIVPHKTVSGRGAEQENATYCRQTITSKYYVHKYIGIPNTI